MYIIVNHYIRAPQNFWALVKEKQNDIPPHLILHGIYPSRDLLRAVSIWEVENMELLKKFLNETFGDFTRNDYYEVNTDVAIGLPFKQKKSASL